MRLIVALFLAVAPAIAFSNRFPVCTLIQRETLFIGEVIDGGVPSLRIDPWHADVRHVRFKVLESFRGLAPGTETVEVALEPSVGVCSAIPYFPGKRYLVTPGKIEGKFHEGGCIFSRAVEQVDEEIKFIRGFFAGKSPSQIRGRIVVGRGLWDMADYPLRSGEAKPAPLATITASVEGKTYSAITDADGRYSLSVPAELRYEVLASLAPYASDRAQVGVPSNGCAIHNFAFTPDSTISGMVWDGKAQPVRDAQVGLIDLDRKNAEGPPWFATAWAEQNDGSFLFKNVPVGRYRLAFNPEGPSSPTEFHGLRNERTYYPRTIEVASSGVHLKGMDLEMGKPVELREVFVRVRFPEGEPMKTALVECVGDPLTEDDVSWSRRGVVSSGVITFHAPVNRTLRIKVSDSHGRDLGRSYAATHKPGAAPIKEEFVVVP